MTENNLNLDIENINNINVDRLVYLAAETHIRIPNTIKKFIPLMSDILNGVAVYGISGYTAQYHGTTQDQLLEMYMRGNDGQQPQPREYKTLISAIATHEIESLFRSTDLSLNEKLASLKAVYDFQTSDLFDFGEESEGSLLDLTAENSLLKTIECPFLPIQGVYGQWVQGIWVIAGEKGTGKSKHLMSLGYHMLEAGLVDEVELYEAEMDVSTFKNYLYNMKDHFDIPQGKYKFKKKVWNIDHIYEEHKQNPNRRRLLLLDSADALCGNDMVEWYHDFIKTLLSLQALNYAIVYTSQVNRLGWGNKPLSGHIAKSKEKLDFCDGAIGLWRKEKYLNSPVQPVYATVLKRRHGDDVTDDNEYGYRFNYVTGRCLPALNELIV